MTTRTHLIIQTNYPGNILVSHAQDKNTGKYAGFIYLMKDGHIHTCLASTEFIYETGEEIEGKINETVKAIAES
jgi:hypothetical protein